MRCLLLVLCASGLIAQGTDPKSTADEYEAHAQLKNAAAGAEFMIHSFSGQGATYVAQDYLIVEAALFPAKGTELEVATGDFTLRLNGKRVLAVTDPQVVKMALQNPEYQPDRSHLEADAGIGDRTVRIGGPPPVPPMYPGREPGSVPPQCPEYDPAAGIPREPRIKAPDLAVAAALPEGKTRRPVSGYLYFAFDGKAGKLKTVELLYHDAVIKLR